MEPPPGTPGAARGPRVVRRPREGSPVLCGVPARGPLGCAGSPKAVRGSLEPCEVPRPGRVPASGPLGCEGVPRLCRNPRKGP